MADQASVRNAAQLIEAAPFNRLLGMKLESAGHGEAVAMLPFDLKTLNPGDANVPVHGGAIASLVDFAACAAVWTLPETRRSATVAMSVNFTGPAVSSDLLAHARVRRKGKTVASLTVEVRDRAGALVADAIVTYKIS